MRTTIELPDDQRSILHFLTAQRGLRGYSKLIQEAIDFYIREKTEQKKNIKHLLKMRGTWIKKKSKKFKRDLREIRRKGT